MIVDFAYATFRMDADMASLALEAVIGGYCGFLKVVHIKDRAFSFVVASKKSWFSYSQSEVFLVFSLQMFISPLG